MSQYISGLLCSLILVGYSTSAIAMNDVPNPGNLKKDNVPTEKNNEPTRQNGQEARPANGPGQSAACTGAAETAINACQEYLNEDLESTITTKSSGNLPEEIKRANIEMRIALAKSFRGQTSCSKKAAACSQACAGQGVEQSRCAKTRDQAVDKHRNFKSRASSAIVANENLLKSIAGNPSSDQPEEPVAGGGAVGGLAGGIVGGGATPEIPTPQVNPQSVPAQTETVQAPPVEKTAEQQKEERREKRAEERRQERIDALGKAFMSLNQQQPLGQALQEKTMATPAQQAAATAAAKVGAKNAPVAKEKDEDDNGRAGFNAMAKKNLQTRKALAAAMGLNADNLQGAAIHPIPNGASGSGGGGIGADGRFEGFSGGGATLDPVVETQRPSDLPQNFRLGAPSAGGGGDSASNPGAQPQKRAPARQYAGRGDHDDSPGRGPAGLSPASIEIRTQAADIWMVMSSAFHRRCAEGRLMDCAEHLPK
jgi:hypothetical protein